MNKEVYCLDSSSSDDDDSVVAVDVGLEMYLTSSTSKLGAEVLGSRKTGVPKHDDQIALLAKIMRVDDGDAGGALSGPRLDAFKEVQQQLKATYSSTISTRKAMWTKPYCARYLALIVAIYEAENKANPPKQPAARG